MPLGTFNLASRYMGGGGAGAVIPIANRIQSTKGVWSTSGTYNYSTDSGKFGDAGYYITSGYLSLNGFYINWNAGEYRGGSSGKEITIEFWFKVYNQYNFGSTIYPLWSANGIPSTGQDFHLRAQSDNLYLYNNGTYNADLLSLSGGANTNTWHHIAYVSNGASSWKVYLNGTLKATISSGNQVNSWYWGVGSGDSNLRRPYIIDEIRVSKTQRYTANFTAPTSAFTNDSDTLALWHCESSADTDDGTGTTAWLPPPAKASAATWTTSSGTWTIASGASALGGALNGSGVRSGYITVNPTDSTFYFNTSKPWTVEMRIWYPGTFGAFENILGIGTSVQGGDVWIRPKDGPVRFTYQANGENNDPGGLRSFTSPSHLAIVSNGSNNVKYFLNGVLEAQGTFVGSNVRQFNLGSQGSIANRIDEVRISHTALYSSNFTVPSFPYTNNSSTTTLAYFPFHTNTTDAS